MKKRCFVVSLLLTVVLVVMSAGPVLAKKPLTTLAFDELPFQPVDGLYFNGVTFGFQIGGFSSNDAWYHAGGPGQITYVQDPSLEGNAMGTLTLTFDQPTTVVEFGVALGYIPIPDPLPAGATVDLYRPGKGWLRQIIPLTTSPTIAFWTEGLFSYSGPAVKTVVITFDRQSGATRFMLDNLKFHKGEHLGN